MLTTGTSSPDIGDRPTVTCTFTPDAASIIPTAIATAVTVRVRKPDGTVSTVSSPNAAIDNPSSNVWRYTFPDVLDQSGTWWVRVESTAGLAAAEEVRITVRSRQVA